jgi:hypothetical protein
VLSLPPVGKGFPVQRFDSVKVTTVLVTLFVLALSGCGGKIDLFNLATGAKATLTYHYGTRGSRGTITGPLGAETVQGEYSLAENAVVGWGSVYGTGGSSTGTAVATGGRRYGAAVLTGDKGTVLNCEFIVGSLSAHGSGVCQDNHEGKYRMLF